MSRLLRTAATAALLVPATTAAPQSAGGAGLVIQTKSGPVTIERLVALEEPWGMAFLPDGRLLVTEKPGRLRIYTDGKLSQPLSGVPKVAYREQGGLLDVEVDPDFTRNGLVYLSYAEAAEQQPADARDVEDPRFGGYFDKEDNVLKGAAVARGRLEGHELRDVKVVWRQVPKTIGRGHFGGRLTFAPDGKLFILSGERMRFDPAQTSQPISARWFASTPTGPSLPTTPSPASRVPRPTSGRSAIATRSARRSIPRPGNSGSTKWGRRTETSSTSRNPARTTAGRS